MKKNNITEERFLYNLGNILDQLSLNFDCFEFLHIAFENKKKDLNDIQFFEYLRKEQIQYLKTCYFNHFAETVNLLNTIIKPSKIKEIALNTLDEKLYEDSKFNEIKKRFEKNKLHNYRHEFLAHKDLNKNHNFFAQNYQDFGDEFFNELSLIVKDTLKYTYEKYPGKLTSYASKSVIFSGLRKIYNEIDHLLSQVNH